MTNNDKKFSLKDELFNKEKVEYLAGLIKTVYPEFDKSKFEKDILSKFPQLELMERIYWIREIIEELLPNDYETTIDILLKSLKSNLTKEDFIFAPYCDYISNNGCTKKHLTKSLNTLGRFTEFFSAEFAIRRFINEFPDKTFDKMLHWSLSKNEHQRRLASEGLRPKLPWGKSINFDYKKAAKPLENLYYDKSRYVTRSVANHLNDISKFDPDYVLEILQKWKESNNQNNEELAYIINHSLRTLIKKGHKSTLQFLGHNLNPKVTVSGFLIKNNKINIGDTLEFSFNLIADKNEDLIIDYTVIYPSLNYKKREKTFKLKKIKIQSGQTIAIEKKHPFRKMTTKKLYTGDHEIEIQINGKIMAEANFHLKV